MKALTENRPHPVPDKDHLRFRVGLSIRRLIAMTCLVFSGNAVAISVVDLEIENEPNNEDIIVVIDGGVISVNYTVLVPSGTNLNKKDKIELRRVSDDSLVDSRPRGKKSSGTVALKAKNAENELVYVRYVRKSDGSVLDQVSHPDDPDFIPIFIIPKGDITGLTKQVDSLQKHVMLCGTSSRDVTTFIPGYPAVELVEGCSPGKNTIGMLVSRYGVDSVDAAELKSYLKAGGIVVGEFSGNDVLYNKAFDAAEVDGPFTGGCQDHVMPQVNLIGYTIFSDVDFNPPASSSGCGLDMQGWTDVGNSLITRVGGWTTPVNSVSLAFRNLGNGRLWLVEADWQDREVSSDYESSRNLMKYMLTHKR